MTATLDPFSKMLISSFENETYTLLAALDEKKIRSVSYSLDNKKLKV